MKEKNLESSFDVMDFIGGISSTDRGSLQSIQNNAPPQFTEPPEQTAPTESTRRISSKQRKASLDEYRELFLRTPKLPLTEKKGYKVTVKFATTEYYAIK